MSNLARANDTPLLIKRKHELADVLKQIEKGSDKAVSYLVEVIEDDKAEQKNRVTAAKTLLELQVKIADTISKDSLTRQIAQLKIDMPVQPQIVNNGQMTRLPPKVDFTTIQTVGE